MAPNTVAVWPQKSTPPARTPAVGSIRPEPTDRGGPDYGRFIEAVRTLQDHARSADAPTRSSPRQLT